MSDLTREQIDEIKQASLIYGKAVLDMNTTKALCSMALRSLDLEAELAALKSQSAKDTEVEKLRENAVKAGFAQGITYLTSPTQFHIAPDEYDNQIKNALATLDRP